MAIEHDFSDFVEMRTNLADDEGNIINISQGALATKEEYSPWYTVSAGKIEAKARKTFSFEIDAHTILKEATVEVADHLKGGRWRVSIPNIPATVYAEIDWASISSSHRYEHGKRVFTITLTNWSHDYGRDFRLYVKYES